MRKVLFTVLFLAASLWGQSKAGPFTISSSTSPCASITVSGLSTVGITVTGTFSMTLQPEVAMTARDGSNAGTPQNTQVTPSTSTTAQSTITAAGKYKGAVGGFDTFLVCVTSYVSGSATIYLNASTAINASLFGGAGGDMKTFAANTMTGSGTIDGSAMSATNGFVLPSAPGAAPTAAGTLAYDSTANQPVSGNGSTTAKLIPLIGSTPTGGDCAKFSVSGTQVGVQDFGNPCVAPSSVPTQVVQSGLLAEYRILSSESAGSLVDYSGNGNNATGTVGTAPTIIAGTGGLNFTGNGAVSLPSALNSGVTFQFVAAFQFSGANQYNALIAGGPGAPSNCSRFFLDDQHNVTNANTNYHFETWKTNFRSTWRYTLQGSAVVTWEIGNGGTESMAINNQTLVSGTDTGLLSSGNFQLGGSAGGLGGGCPAAAMYYLGQIYYVVVYNRQLTQAEVNSNVEFLQNTMSARGLPLNLLSTSTTDTYVLDGDSEIGFVTNAMMSIPATVNIYNLSASGYTIEQLTADAPNAVDPFYQTAANREAVLMWGGTNDSGGSATTTLNYLNGYCRARHLRGFKCGVMTMMDRSGADTFKNSYNTAIRTYWPVFADFLVDPGADPLLGCDGCAANTTYFSTGLHPTTGTANNILAPYIQRGLNRAYGHLDWSSATTYNSAAPAATAITGTSESTNTVTVTSTLNPPVGSCVVISGVTPSGYNNVSGECWNVLTTSASSFTYYNWTSGLGNGTVFGSASVPLQQDADVYSILNFGTGNFTLQPCGGYTGQKIYIKNINGSSSTIVPFGNDLIDGSSSLSISTNQVRILQATVSSASSPLCAWTVIQ